MEEAHELEQKREQPKPPRGLSRRSRQVHSFPLRLKAVKLRLEEGFPAKLITRELGVSSSSLSGWIRCYRRFGEGGLRRPHIKSLRGYAKLSPVVKEQIIALKQRHPSFGVKRIAQLLRRVLFLPGSHETVRRTLHKQKLIQPRRKKPQRNPPKPRFFERSTPNQLWQSDICTVRVLHQNAYLIGFIDDHSRYIVGLDLFRSQTSEHVLEVYRTAVAQFGPPKEMLTDNGRQYTAWRGKTRFEQELRKDQVHHLRSEPHHPMTLGKIERFWKTIWEEFLVRAQFDSDEQARERIRLWVKYYNHQRPHQGLDGLCPADRFFAIATPLRAVIERGLTENTQELALRGVPQSPFYMVGRLGEQSVVLHAEKGQIKMQIDGENKSLNQLTYNLNEEPTKGEPTHDNGNQTQKRTEGVQCPPASAGGAGHLDRTAASGGSVSADGHHIDTAVAVAGAGDGRDDGGAATALSERAADGPSVDGEAGAVTGTPGVAGGRQAGEAGETAGQDGGGVDSERAGQGEVRPTLVETEVTADVTDTEFTGDAGPKTGGVDCPGAMRPDHRDGGSGATGGKPQDILPVGEASAGSAGGLPAGAARGASVAAAGSREGIAPTASAATAGAISGAGADAGDSPTAGGTGAL